MAINRRDVIQILRDENELLKKRNQQVSSKLARLQQAFRVLNDIDEKTRKLSKKTDIAELIYQLLSLVLHTCNTENGSLLLVDEDSQQLEFVEVIGSSRDALLNHRISLDTGIVGNSIKTAKAVLVENVHTTSKKWSSSIDEYLHFQTRSLMCAPLELEGRVIGAIEVVNHSGDNAFDGNDLNIIRVAACYVAAALGRAEKLMISTEINE